MSLRQASANSSLRTSGPPYRSGVARAAVALFRFELQEAYDALRQRIDGLSDAEFFWEPVPGCWTVRRRDDGRWAVDYPEPPHPDPAPLTTIGWRLVHVAECKVMYHEYAFGDAKLTFPEIDSAHTAATAIAQLESGHQMLMRDLDGLDDTGLGREVLTNWGERWPTQQIFWTMISHDLHHGGEIGALRDLYREQVLVSGRSRP
ncbi:MAG: DinB family protein [Chloroflexi bacterium]|nr:MAG: DinB family protein [Chloroflexota bacterium]TMG55605.1 MAG: DinB family protein [Chloroflexota bacterium]